MKTKQVELPRILRNFFGDYGMGINNIPKIPDGYVYFGTISERGYKILPWDTKILGSPIDPQEKGVLQYHVFVEISDVISYILRSDSKTTSLTEDQRQIILEYVKDSGITVPVYKKTKKNQNSKPKKEKACFVEEKLSPIDLYNGPEGNQKILSIHTKIEVTCPSGKRKYILEPGYHAFMVIESPLPYEFCKWLVLKDQLPIIFGKPVSTWQMLLHYDPLTK